MKTAKSRGYGEERTGAYVYGTMSKIEEARKHSRKTAKNKVRRLGKPKTDDERRATHRARYGTSKLPPRGTGLNR